MSTVAETHLDELRLFPMDDPDKTLISTRDAADLAGKATRTIQKWAQDGKIKRVGDDQIDAQSLKAFLEKQQPPALNLRPLMRSDISTMVDVLSSLPPLPRVDAGAIPDSFSEAAMLRQLNQMLEREVVSLRLELADAKSEKAELLSLLQMWGQPPSPRRRRTPSLSTESKASSDSPLWVRVLQYVLSADRPRRVWQVQRDLDLKTSPAREMARLASRGLIERISPGLYTGPGRVVQIENES